MRAKHLLFAAALALGAAVVAGAATSQYVPGQFWTFADGTSSSPSISFANETNTGIMRDGSQTIAFVINGSKRGGVTAAGVTGDSIILNYANGDVILARVAADTLALRRSSNAQAFQIGPSTGYLTAESAALITAGSGTGVTVNDAGNLRTQVYKVTIDKTAFTCAATTCDVTIATLPAKTFVQHALADLTQTFACTGTCTTSTLSATLGKTAGGNQYLLSFDTDAAAAQFGDAAAELGASLAPSTTPTEVGDLASWSSTTAVVMRMTSGTGNIGTGAATNFSQGSVTFYLTTTKMP